MTTIELKKNIHTLLEEELGSMAPSILETVAQRIDLALDAYFLELVRVIDVRKGDRQ